MGTALIVWHFTHDKAQALSALLHDIATPVFAHVIDFANGDHMTQESTEDRTEEMILNSSELIDVINRNGLHTEDVVDYHMYPIADNQSPMLCADRLEYTLGNAVNYRFIDQELANRIYCDLAVCKNESGQEELAFQTPQIAFQFADVSLQCAKIYVSDADRYSMQILAEIISDAMHSNVINEDDLYTTEALIIQKLMRSAYRNHWESFCELKETVRSISPQATGNWRNIKAKKRYIDPYIEGKGRVTTHFPTYHRDLQQFKEESQDYWISGI